MCPLQFPISAVTIPEFEPSARNSLTERPLLFIPATSLKLTPLALAHPSVLLHHSHSKEGFLNPVIIHDLFLGSGFANKV